MPEERPIQVLGPDGLILEGMFSLWDESPDDSGAVRLRLAFNDEEFLADSDEGYFDALTQIRRVIEPMGYRLLCLGASEGVYPSGMSRSMGTGDKAYKLKKGKAATAKDIVHIFDVDVSMTPSTLQEQWLYFDEWVESLR